MFRITAQRDSDNSFRIQATPASTGPGYVIYEFLPGEQSTRATVAGRYVDFRHVVIETAQLADGDRVTASLGDLSTTPETGIPLGLCDVTLIPQKG